MLRDIFHSATGFESFGLISTLIFFVFFFFVVLHAVSLKKKDVEQCSRLPFEDGSKETEEFHEI